MLLIGVIRIDSAPMLVSVGGIMPINCVCGINNDSSLLSVGGTVPYH